MIKSLVFIVVACICIMTIHANVFACTNELTKLWAQAAAFFTKFEAEHNIAHEDLLAIQSANNAYGSSLSLLARVNYGADLPLGTVQCIVKSFIDIASVERVKTSERIKHLKDEIDLLEGLASRFIYKHNLFCRRTVRSGCEADLNQLRCDLSAFFSELSKAAQRAIYYDLFSMEEACDEMGYVERRFKSKYRLVCASDPQPNPQNCCVTKSDTTNLRKDLKKFHTQAVRPYDAANVWLKSLSNICASLTAAIDSWVNKFK